VVVKEIATHVPLTVLPAVGVITIPPVPHPIAWTMKADTPLIAIAIPVMIPVFCFMCID
jgi:hypothetical protein